MKTVINGWTRKEFTTRGSDPTVVVEWSKDAVTIQEFQDCYSLLAGAIKFDGSMVSFVEDLHKTLELAYGQARELAVFDSFESRADQVARLGLPPLE